MKHFKTGYAIATAAGWLVLFIATSIIIDGSLPEISPLVIAPALFLVAIFMVVAGGETKGYAEHGYEKEWGQKAPEKWPHAFRDGCIAGSVWSVLGLTSYFLINVASLWILLVPFFAAILIPGYGAQLSLKCYRKKVEAEVHEKYTSG